MVPDTVASVAGFLLLVAPGLCFQLLRERRLPASDTSGFREASVVVLASLVFTGGAILVLALVRAVQPAWVLDPGAWLRPNNTYLQDHYRLVARTVVVGLVLATGLAVLTNRALASNGPAGRALADLSSRLLPRKGKGGNIQPHGVWHHVFRESVRDRGDDTVPYLSVEMADGRVVFGSLFGYEADPDSDNERELVLGPPLSIQKRKGKMWFPQWDRMVIPRTSIRAFYVSYVAKTALTAPTPPQPPSEDSQTQSTPPT